jgi:thiamine kinase-like enzyme
MNHFTLAQDIIPQEKQPEEKQAAVNRALQETFGTTTCDDVEQITVGNMTSRVFRVVVNGTPYLVKVILRKDDPTCHYTCMRSAAEAGLAPRVLYTNVEDKVSITEFLQTVPLSAEEALIRMPQTLRKLHALPRFPERAPHLNTTFTFLLDDGPARDAILEKAREASMLPSAWEQLADLPQPATDQVSSHNDLFKPDNILFDGRQIWLVDWEAAFLNDRYVDLAVVANMLVTNESEEGKFLSGYFGAPPNDYQSARFFLARQFAHLFYAMAFLMLTSAGKPIDWSVPTPPYSDLQRGFWSGELALKDNESKLLYGKVHWERLQQNLQHPRFAESLRSVSQS